MSEDKKNYADRDVIGLDMKGNYFSRHMLALTAENLHMKADIAAELAWRDAEIDRLKELLALAWPLAKRSVDIAGYSGASGDWPLQDQVAALEKYLSANPVAREHVEAIEKARKEEAKR